MAWTPVKSFSKGKEIAAVALSEEVAAVRDKTLVFDTDVALGSVMEVFSIRIEYTSTATAGTREIALRVTDAADDVLLEFDTGVTLIESASVTIDLQRSASADGNNKELPPLVLGRGFKLVVLDKASSPADATDTNLVHITGRILG